MFGIPSLTVTSGRDITLDWSLWSLALVCGLICLGLTWLVTRPTTFQDWCSCLIVCAALGFAMVASYQQDQNLWMSISLGPTLAVFYGFMRAIREIGINPLD